MNGCSRSEREDLQSGMRAGKEQFCDNATMVDLSLSQVIIETWSNSTPSRVPLPVSRRQSGFLCGNRLKRNRSRRSRFQHIPWESRGGRLRYLAIQQLVASINQPPSNIHIEQPSLSASPGIPIFIIIVPHPKHHHVEAWLISRREES